MDYEDDRLELRDNFNLQFVVDGDSVILRSAPLDYTQFYYGELDYWIDDTLNIQAITPYLLCVQNCFWEQCGLPDMSQCDDPQDIYIARVECLNIDCSI